MFTDEKLQQLHLDEEYKRSNCLFANLKYSVYIVKNGSGFFSLSMSTSPNVSLSINVVKFLWSILKYYYITKELIDFRRKIIEFVLHDYCDAKYDIISHTVNSSYKWMEYNDEKLLVSKKSCIEYLSNVNNRLILNKYSTQDRELSERTLIQTITMLDEIFEEAIKKSRLYKLSKMSYDYLLHDDIKLRCIIRAAMEDGNLTTKGRD